MFGSQAVELVDMTLEVLLKLLKMVVMVEVLIVKLGLLQV